MDNVIDLHSKEITLVAIIVVVLATLLVVVPQLLRALHCCSELTHIEHLKSLEQGHLLPVVDERARLAGRLSLLVPMVVMITAGTVTGFLSIYGSSEIFPVSLAVWVVAGVVSLASITGGVTLVARLAHLDDEPIDEKEEDEYSENPFPR